jgi:hypothetical protein
MSESGPLLDRGGAVCKPGCEPAYGVGRSYEVLGAVACREWAWRGFYDVKEPRRSESTNVKYALSRIVCQA